MLNHLGQSINTEFENLYRHYSVKDIFRDSRSSLQIFSIRMILITEPMIHSLRILPLLGVLDDMMQQYRKNRGGKLALADLKSTLLQNCQLEEQAFLFVFELFQVKKLLAENNMEFTNNVYGSLLLAEAIFNICLTSDNLLKQKNRAQWRYSDHLSFISHKMSLNLDQTNLGQINTSFKTDFSECYC